jgi:transposase
MNEHKVPHRRYTLEFREEATRLANSVGHNEAARRLGVPVSTIGNWSRRSAAPSGTAVAASDASTGLRTRPSVTELEAEVSRLRKELASARLDVEILSKATAYFAKGSR